MTKKVRIKWINITDLSIQVDDNKPRVFENVNAITLCGHPQVEQCNFPSLRRDIENIREVVDFYDYDGEVWVLDMGMIQVGFAAKEIKEQKKKEETDGTNEV